MEVPKPLKILQELLAFEHTISDISIVYIGMLFAPGITLYKFFFITLAFLSARPAALLINRYVGRQFDVDNKKKAHMLSFKISRRDVLFLSVAFAVVFIGSAYMLNTLSFVLSFVVLALFILDPVSKSITPHRHFGIGLIEGLGCLGGYIGITGSFPTTLPLYLIVIAAIFVGGGADIIYTLRHEKFDANHELKTYPVKYGIRESLRYSLYSNAAAGAILIFFGFDVSSIVIMAGAVVSTLILVYHTKSINYKNDRESYLQATAIKSNVWTIMLLAVMLSKFI